MRIALCLSGLVVATTALIACEGGGGPLTQDPFGTGTVVQDGQGQRNPRGEGNGEGNGNGSSSGNGNGTGDPPSTTPSIEAGVDEPPEFDGGGDF